MDTYGRDEYKEKHLAGPGFRFGLSWVVASIAGWGVEALLAQWVQSLHLNTEKYPTLILPVAAGLALGLCTGVTQALVLLPYFKRKAAFQWAGATVLGRLARSLVIALLAGALFSIIPTTETPGLFFGLVILYFGILSLTGGAAGAALGFVQSFVLRRRVPQPKRWVLVNIGASVLIFIAIAAVSYNSVIDVMFIEYPHDGDYLSVNDLYPTTLSLGLVFDFVTTAVYAAITGFVLVDMLRHPTSEAEWSLQVKDKDERVPKYITEAQLSPEALLEAQRSKKQ